LLYKITKNFSLLLLAQGIYKILTFIVTIFIARSLGVIGLGKFSYGLSFIWPFIFFSDFGLSELFIRDVSREPEKFIKYSDAIITLKLFIGIFTLLMIGLLAFFLSFDIEKSSIIILLGIGVVLDSFVYFFRTVFRVNQHMEHEASLIIIEALLKLAVVITVIKLYYAHISVVIIAFAFFIVSLLNFLINVFVFKFYRREVSFSLDRMFSSYLLRTAFPFALVYILSLINFRTDIVMLSILKGDRVAGIFSANHKIVEQMILIPVTLSSVCLPVFSALSDAPHRITSLSKKISGFLFGLSSSIIIVFWFFGRQIINLIYGIKFISASSYLFILSLTLIPFFFKPVIEKILYIQGRQMSVCLLYFTCCVGNIVLNLILIPFWGINGASVATFLCEVIVVIGCLAIYHKNCKIKYAVLEPTVYNV
jgi:O-antigen/teichoic acid export membrane protein